MLKLPMSPAASALLGGMIARAGVPRDRILLSDLRSVDWQSLTFTGERHEIELRFPPPMSGEAARKLCEGLADAEFDLPRHILADIAVRAERATDDGATLVSIEALTMEE